MAHVALGEFPQIGAGSFDAEQFVLAVVRPDTEARVVEHEELGLGADHDGVADPGALDVRLGLLGGAARIAPIGLAGAGLVDIAEQDQARLGGERVHHRRIRVRHQDHVALVDHLPAGDRGAVEHDAVLERLFVDGRDVLGRVLPLAARVGEAQVHVFDPVLRHHLEDLGDPAAPAVFCCHPAHCSFVTPPRSGPAGFWGVLATAPP
jgi:hypothetical protein